jgi:hypothetical protein
MKEALRASVTCAWRGREPSMKGASPVLPRTSVFGLLGTITKKGPSGLVAFHNLILCGSTLKRDNMMFVHPFTLLLTGGVDPTADFTPLFMGLVVGVCVGVLAVAFLLGLYDSRGLVPPRKSPTQQSATTPDLPDAA